MIDTTLVVLQDLIDSDKLQGLCSEMSPASSQDAYEATRVKAEVLSDAEEEEHPVPLTFAGIKTEPEVSCLSESVLDRFHRFLLQ
jgi:hypothetical protein